MDKLSPELKIALIEAELLAEFDPDFLSVYPIENSAISLVHITMASKKFGGVEPSERINRVFKCLDQFSSEIFFVVAFSPTEMVEASLYLE